MSERENVWIIEVYTSATEQKRIERVCKSREDALDKVGAVMLHTRMIDSSHTERDGRIVEQWQKYRIGSKGGFVVWSITEHAICEN